MVNFPSPRALCDKRLQGVESQLDTAHVERFLIIVRLSQLVSWFNPEDNCNCWIWSAPAPHGCCTQCVCGPCLSSRGPTMLPDVKLRNIDSLNWPPPIVPWISQVADQCMRWDVAERPSFSLLLDPLLDLLAIIGWRCRLAQDQSTTSTSSVSWSAPLEAPHVWPNLFGHDSKESLRETRQADERRRAKKGVLGRLGGTTEDRDGTDPKLLP